MVLVADSLPVVVVSHRHLFQRYAGHNSSHFFRADFLHKVSSGGQLLLASGGSTSFSSDGIPSGSVQEPVFTGSSHGQDFTLTIVGA